MNKITLAENADLFHSIVDDCDPIDRIEKHRRWSSFYTEWVIEVTEKWYPDVPREYDGLWMTNQFVYDADYGMSDDRPYEITRVEKKEKITTTITYEPVK